MSDADEAFSIMDNWVRQRHEAEAVRRERFLLASLGPLRRVKRLRALGRLPFGCSLSWHKWQLYEQNLGLGIAWPYWLECRRCHVKIHPPEPA